MFDELDFLFNLPILNNYDNKDSIYNWIKGEPGTDGKGNVENRDIEPNKDVTVVYKKPHVKNTNEIKNYYKNNIYKHSGNERASDYNVYSKLLRDFEDPSFNAMRFKAADFAYLSDLGVYPINRMWTLRRFCDGYTVPDNLQDWDQHGGEDQESIPFPKNTVVGWIKPEEDKNFFNINFNEEWTTIDKRLDEVLMEIISDKEQGFGLQAKNAVPLPGWSQGLLFGFLNAMGITSFDENNIPFGDPAVLQEAASRAKDANVGYGNKSTVSMTLKTSYEQKFIGNVDPANAMLDIMYNCIYMGTRDTKYMFAGGSNTNTFLKKALLASRRNTVTQWWDFISFIIGKFMEGMKQVFNNISDTFSKELEDVDQKSKQRYKKVGNGYEPSSDGTYIKDNNGDYKKIREEIKGTEAFNNISGTLDTIKGLGSGSGEFIMTGLNAIFATTISKWRFAIQGSIGVMDGSNTTPWHLTLGNPYSPFVTFGNVVVKDVKFNFNNELSFNDIPKKLDVEIMIEQGRNLGAQEIFQMFNNGYQRAYNSDSQPIFKGCYDPRKDGTSVEVDGKKQTNK